MMRLKILNLETCQKSDIEQECMLSLYQAFLGRWRNKYLTALREMHKTTGNNEQQVNIGDVVLVNDDSTRVNWNWQLLSL